MRGEKKTNDHGGSQDITKMKIDTNPGEGGMVCGIFERKPVGKTSANVAIERGAWMAD